MGVMASTNGFRNAIKEGDLEMLRIILKDSLLVDPSFSEFEEMETIALGIQGLYEEHDGRAFEENETLWDNEYMSKLMVQVVGNFSHERVEHLKAVVRKLYPVSEQVAPEMDTHSHSKLSYQEQKRHDQMSGNYRSTAVAGGAVVGGIVGGTVGAVASLTGAAVVACVAGGAVVGGAAVAYCTKERK